MGGVSGAWRVVFDGWRFAEGVSDYLYDSLKAVGSGGHCIMDNTRDYLPGS